MLRSNLYGRLGLSLSISKNGAVRKFFTCPVAEMDVRVGGKYLWATRWPDGRNSYNTGKYLDVIPHEKIVFTNCFSDEHGNIVPASYHGLSGNFAMEMVIAVTFKELDGKTEMTLRHVGLPEGEMSDMTKQGWNKSFDKLEESLK